jgi:hypothetical protein
VFYILEETVTLEGSEKSREDNLKEYWVWWTWIPNRYSSILCSNLKGFEPWKKAWKSRCYLSGLNSEREAATKPTPITGPRDLSMAMSLHEKIMQSSYTSMPTSIKIHRIDCKLVTHRWHRGIQSRPPCLKGHRT